jgi:hypothetical protein
VGQSQGDGWQRAGPFSFLDRVTRIALLAPVAKLRSMRLSALLLFRLRPFLPKKEPLAETRNHGKTLVRLSS